MIFCKAIFISILFINLSWASCSNINLIDQEYLKSKGKENLINHFNKPRDQDSVGWCAAYSTSDSLTYAVNEPVSALELTINFHANEAKSNKTDSKSLLRDGMFIDKLVKSVKDTGYCPEAVISSNQTYSSNLGNYTLNEFLIYFQEYVDQTNGGTKSIKDCVSCTEEFFNKYIKSKIPNSTIESLNAIIKKNNGNALESLKTILQNVCGDKRKQKTPIEYTVVQSGNGVNLFSVIQNSLHQDIMPTIVINTKAFAKDESVIDKKHGDHALVVTASKLGANGKCLYNLRNSWGRSCSYYIESVRAQCDEKTGSFWLTEEEISQSISLVSSIKKTETANQQITRKPPAPIEERVIENKNKSKKELPQNNRLAADTKKKEVQRTETEITSEEVEHLQPIDSNIMNAVSNLFQNIMAGSANYAKDFWGTIGKTFRY